MADCISLQNKTREFLSKELYLSAEKVGGLLLCCSRNDLPNVGEGSHAVSLELYGDALFGKKEYLRSLSYYKQATQRRKVGNNSDIVAGLNSLPSYSAITCSEESELKFKEARCHIALKDITKGIRSLEMIPSPLRSLAMNLALGSSYLQTGSGSTLNALEAYKQALRQDSFAIEAIDALVELGVNEDEIKRLSSQSASTPWLEAYISGLTKQRECEYTGASSAWRKLDHAFPSNPTALLNLGTVHLAENRLDESQLCFKKARTRDPLNIDSMDQYACLMHTLACSSGLASELNRLAHDLVAIDPKRPEAWLACSLWQDASGDKEQALGNIEKALKLSPRCFLAHRVRGELLSSLERPHDAIISFFKAKELKRDLRSYKGLVTAYLAAGKLKEALISAKEANARLGGCAGAVVLLGQVLASEETTDRDKEKAKILFTKALTLDSTCIDAMTCLADLHSMSGDYIEASKVLKTGLMKHNIDILHVKLGDVLSYAKLYSESLQSYHTALALSPHCETAKNGMERLEKLMRGINPDHENEEEEEDSDLDGDSSEVDASLEGAQFR